MFTAPGPRWSRGSRVVRASRWTRGDHVAGEQPVRGHAEAELAQDIEEAHLRFARRSFLEENDEAPSLKKFAGPTDWRNLRKKIKRFVEVARQNGHPPQPVNLGNLMVRLPGQSHNYLRAREVTLSTPERHIQPGQPLRMWLHMKRFDSAKMRKVHEPTLNEISER
eukprot:Skav204884  [mRNA]  locus=scaffold2602:182553:185937:+ [translate_table: standard]